MILSNQKINARHNHISL